MGDNLSDLPDEQRLARFREIAEEAWTLARELNEFDVQLFHARIGTRFDRMARELDAEIAAQKQFPTLPSSAVA